ncbi:MAG: hypothetical protein U0Q15_15655 [Kineosporiaceae bacterium]
MDGTGDVLIDLTAEQDADADLRDDVPDGTAATAGREARPDPGPDPGARAGDDGPSGLGAAALTRVALDVHLDATWRVLAAAARSGGAWEGRGARPWRRWLVEDVETAHDLAAVAAGMSVALPAALGERGEGDGDAAAEAAASVARLRRRYAESARVLRAALSAPGEGGEAAGDGAASVRRVLDRCSARASLLAVMERAQPAASVHDVGFPTQDRPADPEQEPGHGESPRRLATLPAYLPGELLG